MNKNESMSIKSAKNLFRLLILLLKQEENKKILDDNDEVKILTNWAYKIDITKKLDINYNTLKGWLKRDKELGPHSYLLGEVKREKDLIYLKLKEYMEQEISFLNEKHLLSLDTNKIISIVERKDLRNKWISHMKQGEEYFLNLASSKKYEDILLWKDPLFIFLNEHPVSRGDADINSSDEKYYKKFITHFYDKKLLEHASRLLSPYMFDNEESTYSLIEDIQELCKDEHFFHDYLYRVTNITKLFKYTRVRIYQDLFFSKFNHGRIPSIKPDISYFGYDYSIARAKQYFSWKISELEELILRLKNKIEDDLAIMEKTFAQKKQENEKTLKKLVEKMHSDQSIRLEKKIEETRKKKEKLRREFIKSNLFFLDIDKNKHRVYSVSSVHLKDLFTTVPHFKDLLDDPDELKRRFLLGDTLIFRFLQMILSETRSINYEGIFQLGAKFPLVNKEEDENDEGHFYQFDFKYQKEFLKSYNIYKMADELYIDKIRNVDKKLRQELWKEDVDTKEGKEI